MATIGKINTIVSTNIKPLTTGLGKAAGAIKTFGSKIAGLAALAGGAGGLAAVGAGIRDFASEGAALQKLSVQTGAAVGELSSLRAVAGRLAIDGDDLTGSIEELNIRLGEAIQDGTGPLAESFKKLGLDAEQLSRMPLTDRFGEISDALGTIQNQAERGFLMDEIFGGDAFKIAPLINQGSDGIKTLADEARDLGMVMGEGQVQAATQFTGAWKTVKSGVGGILREIGGLVLSVFDFSGGTSTITSFVKRAREGIKSLTPILKGFMNVATAAWEVVSSGATTLWNAIGMGGATTFESIQNGIVDFLSTAEYVWKNLPEIAAFAWEKTKLGALTLFEDIKFFFTDQLVPIVEWFSRNWKDIFKTIFDYTATIFINLGKNIRNAMKVIWDFIKSGGRKGLKFTWTPLTEGFKSSVKELPDIPKRALTELEKEIGARASKMGQDLSNGLSEHVASRRAELLTDDVKTPDFEKIENVAFDFADDAGKNIGENVANKLGELEGPAAVRRDSAEAFSAIFSAMRGNGADKQLKVAESQDKKLGHAVTQLKKIAMNPAVELVAGSV